MQSTIEQDVYFMILPQELMDELGISVGDTLIWEIEEDKVTFHKKSS